MKLLFGARIEYFAEKLMLVSHAIRDFWSVVTHTENFDGARIILVFLMIIDDVPRAYHESTAIFQAWT